MKNIAQARHPGLLENVKWDQCPNALKINANCWWLPVVSMKASRMWYSLQIFTSQTWFRRPSEESQQLTLVLNNDSRYRIRPSPGGRRLNVRRKWTIELGPLRILHDDASRANAFIHNKADPGYQSLSRLAIINYDFTAVNKDAFANWQIPRKCGLLGGFIVICLFVLVGVLYENACKTLGPSNSVQQNV